MNRFGEQFGKNKEGEFHIQPLLYSPLFLQKKKKREITNID